MAVAPSSGPDPQHRGWSLGSWQVFKSPSSLAPSHCSNTIYKALAMCALSCVLDSLVRWMGRGATSMSQEGKLDHTATQALS